MQPHHEEIPLSAKSAGVSFFSFALVLYLVSAGIQWDRQLSHTSDQSYLGIYNIMRHS